MCSVLFVNCSMTRHHFRLRAVEFHLVSSCMLFWFCVFVCLVDQISCPHSIDGDYNVNPSEFSCHLLIGFIHFSVTKFKFTSCVHPLFSLVYTNVHVSMKIDCFIIVPHSQWMKFKKKITIKHANNYKLHTSK